MNFREIRHAESTKDQALYAKSFGLIEFPDYGAGKNEVLDAILSSKLAIADVGRLRSLISHFADYDKSGRTGALARILIACSRPDLIGKDKESEDSGGR